MDQKTYTLEAPYLGLSNIGATCYMNSVLSTLFMTPEFRRGIYLWKYQKNVHGDDKDSIPFQLQKLYARLQTKIFDYIDTRDLTKSFQWDVHQAFEQHDIQEFIRVLFDAIEQSDENCNFVKDLYEGTYLHYTKCLTCNYESQRQQIFLDYTLIVKDKYSKTYNDTLELALQRSLKPERLEKDNKYFCEACQSKQDAERGQTIHRLPPILTLHLSRFTFDYEFMRRQKLDDKLVFPFVLNMNNYTKGYTDIPNKLNEETDPKYFEEVHYKPKPQSKMVRMEFPPVPPIPGSKASKKPTKTNLSKVTENQGKTKDFISEMRKKKQLNSQNQEQNEEIQIFAKDDVIDPIIQSVIEKSIVEINQNTQNNQENQLNQTEIQQQQQQLEIQIKSEQQSPQIIQEPEQQQILQQSQSPEKVEAQKILDTTEDRQRYKEYLNHKQIEQNMKCNEQIKEYLQQGDQVYQLYSILNHSGGAQGGHYYAFIKSFEDGNWYNFNDSSVTRMDPDDIQKRAYGGNINSSAYMLFYRRVEKNQPDQSVWGGKFIEEELPEYIKVKLQEERDKLTEYLKSGGQAEDMAILTRPMTLKVYYKLEVKTFTLESNSTFKQLFDQVMTHFQIQDTTNCRLRVYNPHTDQMQETFEGKEMRALGAIRIAGKCLALEFKNQNEEWGIYNENIVNYRVALWREGLLSLDEKTLNLQKISVAKSDNIFDLIEATKIHFKCENQELMAIRRMQEYGEILDLTKPLEQFQENYIFYIEKKSQESIWIKEFDQDQHRISIKFNNPKEKSQAIEGQPNDEYPLICPIDDRANMGILKNKMCQMVDLDPQKVIMRRGGRAGLELKDLEIEVGLNHFVKGSSIHLELGTPVQQGEYRCLISIATSPNLLEDRNFYVFQEIGEYAVPGDKPISQFLQKFIAWVSEKCGQEIDYTKVRLRERIADRLNKVYRDRPLKEQGIIEMRMIAIEILGEEQHFNQKDVLIHVRYFDQQKWDLSERHEFIVQKNQSGIELGQQLSQVFNIRIEDMEMCRIVSIQRFSRCELINEEWISLNSDLIMLGSQPLFITNDGQLLILRDGKQEQRELTPEEIKQYGIIQSHYTQTKRGTPFGNGGTQKKYYVEEKALKITVKKKVDEECQNIETEEKQQDQPTEEKQQDQSTEKQQDQPTEEKQQDQSTENQTINSNE